MEEKIFWVCMGSEHILDSTIFGTTTALFLDTKFASQIPLCKKKITITSKCRHMYGVQNVDEIKN
jgi:hypothetical protein